MARLLSLFSGCGGMDLGFEGGFNCLKKSVNQSIHADWIKENKGNFVELEKTMFELVFANDINPYAKLVWDKFFNKKEIYHLGSVVDLVKTEKFGLDIFPRNIDIVTGGFPCQDFSVAGKRLGFNSRKSHLGALRQSESEENRGLLYTWMKEVISITEPKVFIAENVKGLVNLSNAKDIIQEDFKSATKDGYIVLARVLNAADYGVPQNRQRVIFIGFKKSALTRNALQELRKEDILEFYDPYPQKTHTQAPVTCEDAFIDLLEPELSQDLAQRSYSCAKFMNNRSQGQSEINLKGLAPTIRAEHHGNIEFRRLDKINGGKNEPGLKQRRLSVRECARLQTFPDNYEFVLSGKVSASQAYRLIGNAVPPLLAYNLAKNLEKKWTLYFGDEK